MARFPDADVVELGRDYAVTLCHLLAHLIELDRKLDDLRQRNPRNTTGTARSLG